jgi:hypothetical protein
MPEPQEEQHHISQELHYSSSSPESSSGSSIATSFDELAKAMASGTVSRRKALRLMGAALVGGTLASLGIGEAAADLCKRNGKVCKKNTQCCSGNCSKSGTSSSGTCADAPPTCGAIGATCSVNTDCCSGRCASGVCAEPCPSDRVLLSNGSCARSCTSVNECLAAGCDPTHTDCEVEFGTGASYCRNSGGLSDCTSTAACPTGQFCVSTPNPEEGVCATVC